MLHTDIKFRAVPVTCFFFCVFSPLAVDPEEVQLTGRACQVQRQRRMIVDQSPMTHSEICNPQKLMDVTTGSFTERLYTVAMI